MRSETAQCCIVGGGPAGMMAGFLLARQGVDVMVLEKHEDFFRDFRGDTIHPATLQVLDELGVIDEFLKLRHTRMERVTMETPSGPVTFADFTKVARPYGYIAFVPQWDFLEFLYGQARRYPTFRLLRSTHVTDLVEDDGEVVGVRAMTGDGPLEVRAALVIGADGRHSTVRERSGLDVLDISAPIDVLWFRLSRPSEERVPFFQKQQNSVIICIDRGDYWQIAYVIPHRGFDAVQQRGLPAFRSAVAAAAPNLADRVDEISDWDQVKLLSVRVDRLRTWYRAGLLCIGDAAHAMSPAGGVGINLAIQDAVAAANIVGPTFRGDGPTPRELRKVQRRRELPTRMTQAFQVKILRDLYPTDGRSGSGHAESREASSDPPPIRLMRRVPQLRHLTGRFIGQGVRPEHVRVPAAASGRVRGITD